MIQKTVGFALTAFLTAGPLGALDGALTTAGRLGAPRAIAVVELVGDLEDLAAWCHAERLFAERDEVLGSVLHFRPDHEEARRRLKFRRTREGWRASSSYRKPRSRATEDQRAELEQRRARIARAFSDVRSLRIELEPIAARPDALDELHADLVVIDPDCTAAREARGEVRDGRGDWVLAETATARARRPELAAEAHRLLSSEVEVRPSEVSESELDLGCPGTAFDTTHVRVVGGVSPRELETLARHAEAAVRLLLEAANIRHFRPRPFRILVAASAGQRRSFERSHEALLGRGPSFARFSNYWVPNTRDLVLADRTPEQRLQQVRRQAVALVLADRYGVLQSDTATFEALATYVTGLLGEEDVGSLPRSLEHLLACSDPPTLAQLAAQSQSSGLGADAEHLCRALGAFLLEGDPRRTRAVLGWLGKSHSLRDAVERSTHRDLAHLEARLWRWIREA